MGRMAVELFMENERKPLLSGAKAQPGHTHSHSHINEIVSKSQERWYCVISPSDSEPY